MTAKSKAPPHGNTKYPWELWQNGEWHTAKRGRQFTIEAESFRKSLGSRAAAEDLNVTTRVSGDTVTFRFSAKEP